MLLLELEALFSLDFDQEDDLCGYWMKGGVLELSEFCGYEIFLEFSFKSIQIDDQDSIDYWFVTTLA